MKINVVERISEKAACASHVIVTSGRCDRAEDERPNQRPKSSRSQRGLVKDASQQIGNKRSYDQRDWKVHKCRMKWRHFLSILSSGGCSVRLLLVPDPATASRNIGGGFCLVLEIIRNLRARAATAFLVQSPLLKRAGA